MLMWDCCDEFVGGDADSKIGAAVSSEAYWRLKVVDNTSTAKLGIFLLICTSDQSPDYSGSPHLFFTA